MKVNLILAAYWDGHDLPDLARRVGMTIPPNVKDHDKYFLDNVAKYENVLNRDPKTIRIIRPKEIANMAMSDMPELESCLSCYTDAELFAIFGFYVIYTSRQNLICNLLAGLYGTTYFIVFDENKSTLNVRYGCNSGSSTIVDEKHMNKKNIGILRNLKTLISMYNYLQGANEMISRLDKVIDNKITYQTSLWPQSKSWLR